jgi:hypothetical protein
MKVVPNSKRDAHNRPAATRACFCPNCGRPTKFAYSAFITLGIVGGLIAIAAIKY